MTIDNRMTNNRQGNDWFTCDRCGFQFPRPKMKNQNGLNVCTGPSTNGCGDDLVGHSANERQLDIPYEEPPDTLPWEDIEF